MVGEPVIAYVGLPTARALKVEPPGARVVAAAAADVAITDLAQCVGAVEGLGDALQRRAQPAPKRR